MNNIAQDQLNQLSKIMKNTKTKSGSTKKLKLTSLEHENNDIEPIKLNSLNSRNS